MGLYEEINQYVITTVTNNNMIIVINYYLNNISDEIDDIYYIDPEILNYKGLLELYNKNTNLSIYLPNKQRIS